MPGASPNEYYCHRSLHRRSFHPGAAAACIRVRGHPLWTIPPLLQNLESLLEEIQSATVLKASEAQVVVGSVRATLHDKTCMIGRLIVEPALQGQGIGSSLLQAIEAMFPQAELFELFTGSKSERNIRLYRRHGYEITGAKQLSGQVSFVVMTKPARASV